MNDVESDRIK